MDTHSLARTQAEAQAQALAFQGIGGAAAARRPPAQWPLAALAAAALAALLGGAAATYAMTRPAPPPVAAPEAPTPARHPARLWETSADDVPAGALQAPAMPPAASAESVPAAGGPLAVRLVDGELRIEARNASRHDAVRLFAELTGTTLLGEPDTLARARPLSLQWSGRDLRAAWIALLGNDVSHGLQCEARGMCRVWVLGPSPASASGAAVAAEAARAGFAPPQS